MPAKTEAQAHFMRAIAHGWHPTQEPYKDKELPSMKVAKEFSHMAHGGEMTTCPKCGHSYAYGGDIEPASEEEFGDNFMGDDDDWSAYDTQGQDLDTPMGPSFQDDARRSFVTMIRLGRK